jgi:hypothetical protein
LNMATEKWKDFIFSDECRLQTYANVTRLVRRPKNCKYGMNYVVQTKKYGGVHIMVWGAIKGDGSRILVRCPRRLNSTAYQDVLAAGLFHIYDSESVFVQDNAPCHKSESTMKYLEKKHICLLSDWPPQSPDINIIENLWSILKSKVDKRSPKSTSELWKAVEEEFYSIPHSVIINLYDSIPRRLQAVLKNNGAHTKY